MFKDKAIANTDAYQRHLNKYNVIILDIAYLRTKARNATETLEILQNSVIEELKEEYPEALKGEYYFLPNALEKINKELGERFVVVIDEWDALFRDDKFDLKAQDDYINLLRGLFKGMQSQNFILLAYITGILPIKRYNSESTLNNFWEYTMVSPQRLAPYVGFTEEEVKGLCKQFDMDFAETRRWYDGYSFNRQGHVYCPNSVTKAMISGEFNSYWTGTVAYESLKTYITLDFENLRNDIIYLLAGGRCKVDADSFQNDLTNITNKDHVLTLLVHLGYLGFDASKSEVYIPNEEVRNAFSRTIKETDWTPVTNSLKASEQLLRATWNGDENTVASAIDKAHSEYTSILEYNDENSLRCVLRLAYYNAVNYYTVLEELPTGKGLADVVFLPRHFVDKPAMVIELKYDKEAVGAIEQIKHKDYPAKLLAYKNNLLLVGINYDKTKKKHSCLIEKL